MNQRELYGPEFYARYTATSEVSAQAIVPEIIKLLRPASVVDVGCGEGVWLKTFADCGVARVCGIDGDYVRRDRLKIPADRFQARDLSKPFEAAERFALAVSLEVAEHLPESSAEAFVRSLTSLSDTVLFSAAVPFQTGANHINLQWQDYWADLFAARGYVAVDAIRPIIWQNALVSFWYRQNMLLFVEKDHIKSQPALMQAWERTRSAQLSVAHPQFVTFIGQGVSPEQLDSLWLGQVVPRLPRMLLRSLARRLGLGGARRK